jgi:hypothetical protein
VLDDEPRSILHSQQKPTARLSNFLSQLRPDEQWLEWSTAAREPRGAPDGEIAPIAVLRCSHAEWRGSTLTRPSRRRQQTVGSAEKRTFAPDFTDASLPPRTLRAVGQSHRDRFILDPNCSPNRENSTKPLGGLQAEASSSGAVRGVVGIEGGVVSGY